MLACISVESTDLMSAQHTHGWIYFLLQKYFPHVSPWQLWDVNLMIRKTGHVVGYGLLSATLYRALRGTFERPVKWQGRFAFLAILATAFVASADEIHQMSLPSRTGTWHDIVLDTSAAILTQILIYFYLTRTRAKTPAPNTAAANS
jgi:VanZ family protein